MHVTQWKNGSCAKVIKDTDGEHRVGSQSAVCLESDEARGLLIAAVQYLEEQRANILNSGIQTKKIVFKVGSFAVSGINRRGVQRNRHQNKERFLM